MGPPLLSLVRRATERASWLATLCVPAMNRIDGPRPKAAGAPTKYKPGTDDWPARVKDRVPALRGDPRPEVCWQVRQPGEVNAETGAGDHVIDIEAGPARTVK